MDSVTNTAEIGRQLKSARESKGISYYRIFRDLGMPINTIKRCEVGKSRIANLIKLCNYLEVKVNII